LAAHFKERQIPLILIAVGFAAYLIAAHAGGVVPTLIAVVIGGIMQTALLNFGSPRPTFPPTASSRR
jgi:hypothetical protein